MTQPSKTCGNCGHYQKFNADVVVPYGDGLCLGVAPMWARLHGAGHQRPDIIQASDNAASCPCWKPQERKDK